MTVARTTLHTTLDIQQMEDIIKEMDSIVNSLQLTVSGVTI